MKIYINHKSRTLIILFFVALAIGYILSYQFNIQKRITKIQNNNEDASLAVEVASLITANDVSAQQYNELSLQKDKLASSSTASNNALQNLDLDIEKYKIIAGKTDVIGPGVIITLNDSMFQTQVIDFINALRNIGFEALSVNGKRVLLNTSFIGELGSGTIINVIGDSNLLKEGLERSGGILEQTEIRANINKSDSIKIKALN